MSTEGNRVRSLVTALVIVILAGLYINRVRPRPLLDTPAELDPSPMLVGAEPELYGSELDLGPIVTPYDRAAYWLWSLESSCGTAPAWRVLGPDGEVGQWQATPIWREDFRAIFGREARVHSVNGMYQDVSDWLWWWWHNRHGDGQRRPTVEELVTLYQRGPSHD